MTNVHVDPLETALTRYFECRGQAGTDLSVILQHFRDDPELSKCACRLQSAFQSYAMMSRREEVDLSRLLRALERDIIAGTSQRYVDDEYCISGGGYETVLTDAARHLTKVNRCLVQVQCAWSQVQQAIAVEQELLRMRG